ncbi:MULTISPECIES: STAS domain-containing protein [unclassified Streptomyces]|uniref:STAS domain-containing protein n=1 Tax=unclassified Streptomyces TaxID=2593676 RepID=UPI001F0472B0|nr:MULTISPECIES: STAS domain-containing protein [unclassified Streptomyces]MCH0564144.1 STAS domain-containing protein [Streptomyces sp. MUM 2J]MCH0568447.1 STAS domain-containing protein [Streptomyces sp. MUM 136J]
MTIEWRYTSEQGLGILSVAGYLGPDAVHRFGGAVGWVIARGSGPIILDLTELRSWSAEGQLAITEAAHRLAGAGRSLALAAIPADGSLVPHGDCPDIPVHCDLAAALAAHARRPSDPEKGLQAWRTDGWPASSASPLTD